MVFLHVAPIPNTAPSAPNTRRSSRLGRACASLLFVLLAPLLTSAQGLDELSDLELFQERISAVIERAQPATVGIRVGNSSGSGVLVSADGLVVTAGHVIVSPGRTAVVTLSDGREFRADTLGTNHQRDSGMLQLRDAHDLPHVTLPPPSRPAVGSWCVAVGHPGGYEEDRPPVPRLGRVIAADGRFLHTDCPIIHGDSGGPLFDLDGRLIGIHSRIETEVSGNYHVPMSTYRLGWRRLLAGEEWRRAEAKLGVTGLEDAGDGARITNLRRGRPAEQFGMERGDVILRMAGEIVDDADQLKWYLADLAPGDLVLFDVRRGEEELSLAIELGGTRPRPEPEEEPEPEPDESPEPQATPEPQLARAARTGAAQ